MNILIPFQFRIRWNAFFSTTFAQFLGYPSYTEATPIVKAFIDFSRLALAVLIVWLVVKIFTKGIRFIFG